MDVLIREFERKDAASVSEVICRTMTMSNSKDYSPEILEPLIKYFSPEKILLLSQERICLVAEFDGKIIGTAALENAELCTFFVHPDFQGKGVGKRLLKAVEDAAARNKIKTIKFASSLTAVSFYEKMGYRKNGRDKTESAGGQIGMEKNLSL